MEERIKEIQEKNENLYQAAVKKRRLMKILEEIFVKRNYDLFEISLAVELYEPTVVKYLRDEDLILSMFTKEEYENIKIVVAPIIESLQIIIKPKKNIKEEPKLVVPEKRKPKLSTAIVETKEERKYNMVKGVISDILYSRYSIAEIAERNYISENVVDVIVNDNEYLISNFGISTQKLKEKIESNRLILLSKPRTGTEIVIKDAFYISLVKDNVYYLQDYDYNRLRIIGEYLKSECNLEKVCEELNVDARAIWSSLHNENIVKIIKPELLEWFKKIRAYESIFHDLNVTIKAKKDVISQIIEKLKSSDYNVDKVSQELGIPRHLMRRILNKDILLSEYDRNFADMIIGLFKAEDYDKNRRM